MSARVAFLLLPLMIAGCAERPAAPVAVATAPPPPVTVPPPPPASADWRDAPETPGGWTYVADAAAPVARFGRGDAIEFELRCERAARIVTLSRLGTGGGTMTIKTSYGERSWPVQAQAGRTSISLGSADPFLEQLAFSRGRFSVALEGSPLLLLPAWGEPARVIEECRL